MSSRLTKELKFKELNMFSKMIFAHFGITYNEAKKEMLQIKLQKLMKKLDIACYEEYYNYLLKNTSSPEWKEFVDEITIHKTNFFRENNHFEFIQNNIETIFKYNPRIKFNNEIRVWSSACSTGEEAYTIAMVLKEILPANMQIKILATDISTKTVSVAMNGIYTPTTEDKIKRYYLDKYFTKKENKFEVNQEIKNLVTFRSFNLMNLFPFKSTFDIIFCRNVMIYFDFDTQENLIRKFYDITTPGGLLLIGHSESLTNKQYKYKYLQPTIYLKELNEVN